MTAVDSTVAPNPASLPRDLGWRRADVIALILVLVAAIGVRIAGIDAIPSADELWHLAMTRGEGSPVGMHVAGVVSVDSPRLDTLVGAAPVWNVWTHMDGLVHPPLYLCVLRVWRDIFGPGRGSAHALSIVCSAFAIGLCFAAARLALGRAAAVWATLLVAVSPVQIYFAQEIRSYEFMIAFGALALWLATRIEVRGPSATDAAALGFTSLPLLLSHYFAATAVFGIAVYSVIRLRGRPRVAFIVATALAGGIYAIIWLPFALRQVSSLSTGDAFARVPYFDLAVEAPWALGIPARMFVEIPWISGPISGATSVAFGSAMLVWPWYRRRHVPGLAAWAAWLCGTVAVLVALDAARSTWLVEIVRYSAIASVAAPLIFVGIARSYGTRALHATGAAAVILMLAFRPAGIVTVADAPQFGGIARWLSGRVAPGEAILVVVGTGGEHAADLLLMTLAQEPGLFPRTVVKAIEPLTPTALVALPPRVWAVMVDRDDALATRILRDGALVESHGIKDEGICELYDFSIAKRVAATRPASR